MSETAKFERLVDLLALLLNSRRPVPGRVIRERIPGYEDGGDEAFHRKFERDKSELRDLGYRIESHEPLVGESGYLIDRDDALLKDPGLTGDEMAALALAAHAWGGSGREGPLAVLKLSIGSDPVGARPAGWVLPRVEVDKRAASIIDAIARSKAVRFTYVTGTSVEGVERVVEPHRLTHRGGWYLTGTDRDRGATRHFKLSRIVGPLTVLKGKDGDFTPPTERAGDVGAPWEADDSMQATVRFAPEVVWWAERRTGAQRIRDDEAGWVELALSFGHLDSFAAWLAGFGERAVVLEPQALREAVVAHLRGVVGRHAG